MGRNNIEYIFGGGDNSRFAWLQKALLGDIQTSIDGSTSLLQTARDSGITDVVGAGNLSIPILVSTALELSAALFTGSTPYPDRSKYQADQNVRKFVRQYLPSSQVARIILLFWDGVRNGIDHVFSPRTISHAGKQMRFRFYVQDHTVPSEISKDGSGYLIMVNSIEFYQIVKQAIGSYESDLRVKEKLQKKFRRASESIESHVTELKGNKKGNDLISEFEYLNRKMKANNHVPLFK